MQQYFCFPIKFNTLYVITEAHSITSIGDFKTCSIYNPDTNGFTINVDNNGYVALTIAIGN